MDLIVIGSNSKGNSYILNGRNSALLIECGMPYSDIQKAINFNVEKIELALVSHEHMDHSKSMQKVLEAGIPIASSKGTFEACKISENQNVIILSHGKKMQYKDWTISAFSVEHDAAEPLGFIIEHVDCGRVLFLTDTYMLKYNLGAFDHVIIEANYSQKIVDKLREGKKHNQFLEKRRLTAHMSFETTLLTLQRLDLTNCKSIVLIHLSDIMTDEKEFVKQCESMFGVETYCANKGNEFNFSKSIFE